MTHPYPQHQSHSLIALHKSEQHALLSVIDQPAASQLRWYLDKTPKLRVRFYTRLPRGDNYTLPLAHLVVLNYLDPSSLHEAIQHFTRTKDVTPLKTLHSHHRPFRVSHANLNTLDCRRSNLVLAGRGLLEDPSPVVPPIETGPEAGPSGSPSPTSEDASSTETASSDQTDGPVKRDGSIDRTWLDSILGEDTNGDDD